jgi:flavin-dependent dehydrogenase
VGSVIVDSLGLNKDRTVIQQARNVANILEGVECTIPGHQSAWLHFDWPDLSRTGLGHSFGMGTWGENLKFAGANWREFARLPQYAPWFRNVRVVKEVAVSATIRSPIREPVAGNVVLVGDAAAPIETWRQGAVAAGFLAVKAIEKELKGQKGYPEYINWWQKAFYFNEPGYFRRTVVYASVFGRCSGEEIDYIYQLLLEKRVAPGLEVARTPGLVSKERPDLYQKLKQSIDQALKSIGPLLKSYPPEADGSIYGDASPNTYLGPWRTYPDTK